MTGYKAEWVVDKPEDSDDSTPGKNGTEGEGDNQQPEATGKWQAASIGGISATGMSELLIEDIRTSKDDYGSSNPAPEEDPVYSAKVGSINLEENWYAATARVAHSALKPAKTDDGEEAKDSDLTEDGWDKTKYQNVLDELKSFVDVDGAKELTSTISGSDLDVVEGLVIKKNVTTIDLNEKYEVDGGWQIPEKDDKGNPVETTKEGEIKTDAVQHTAVTLNITDSRLRIGGLTQETGTINIGETEATKHTVNEVLIDDVSTMDGTLSFRNGLLALNVKGLDREEIIGAFPGKQTTALEDPPAEPSVDKDGKWVYVGNTVKLGENAKIGLGKDWEQIERPTVTPLIATDEETTPKTGSEVTIAKGTKIAFNTRTYYSNGLLAGSGDDALLQIDIKGQTTVETVNEEDKIQFISKDSPIGSFNLAQGFRLVDSDGLSLNDGQAAKIFDASGIKIDAAWGEDDVTSYVNKDGQIIVGDVNGDGKVTSSEYRVLSDLAPKNLVDHVLAGNRGETLDQRIINAYLSRVHKSTTTDGTDPIPEFSADQAVLELNSIANFAAVSALKAMTVDFSGYVQDQIEHHAYTIPHEMRGWWVQPIGSRMKTDDLRAGALSTGYSLDTYGIMGGYDWTVPNGDIWGIAASYQSGDADGEGNALDMSSDVSAKSFHIWAARHIGDLRVMGAFTYMQSESDATMKTSIGSLTSDELAATSLSFGVRADLTKTFGNFKLVPHVGARASMIDMDDFTVTWSEQEAFKYSEDKSWLFEVPVGITAATAFEYQRWNVQPYVDLTVRGRFGDTDGTATVTGAGNNVSDKVNYDVTGDVIGDLRLGYMSTFQNLNLGMSYGFSAGDAGRQNHTLEATLRIDL